MELVLPSSWPNNVVVLLYMEVPSVITLLWNDEELSSVFSDDALRALPCRFFRLSLEGWV